MEYKTRERETSPPPSLQPPPSFQEWKREISSPIGRLLRRSPHSAHILLLNARGERNSGLYPSGLFLAFGTVIDTSSLGRLASRIRCVKKGGGGCDFLALDQNVMRGGAHVMKEKLGGGGTQDLYFRGIPLPGKRKITEQFY